MLSRELTLKYQNKALDALKKINQPLEETKKAKSKTMYDRYIFEQYSDTAMTDKLKHDSAYFNILFENIAEDKSPLANTLLIDLSKTIKSIYEYIDIEPRSIGMKAISLNENDDIISENATRIINEFIDVNYYSLSQEKRDTKYKNYVIAESESLVLESSIDPVEATTFCYKCAVMESLIEKISFPEIIKFKIDETMTSDIDQQVFEQTELIDLWSEFQIKTKKLSKLISTVV